MWKLYRAGSDVLVDTFHEPQDCFGDDLYDAMAECGYIDSVDNIEVDGDGESIAVMHKTLPGMDWTLIWEEDRPGTEER